ncbi:formate dehydrogenase accessory sulfurtransferase FdhD [Acidocella sp.]|uniref:formate dehydrogenase accessory sulfurtransferase FdhD n=1 Tax=Acidocella sp. TaxID=50710 RepID=UPI00260C8117|nr:formate dehydrogenase accessory sulfurtransferase FdhD [Acidocella sp.]
MSPMVKIASLAWRNGRPVETSRTVPEEMPIALSYDFIPFGVMMATPDDLEEFAIGFSLTEGIIRSPNDLAALEVIAQNGGYECRMMLRHGLPEAVKARRRIGAGPVGCGLCGVEQIEGALRALPPVPAGQPVNPHDLHAAFSRLPALQTLNTETRAVHAAAFWVPQTGEIVLREDVGRHNALDKLAGALAKRAIPPASGVVLMTSRVSIELVQKTAMLGAPVIAAISAPTALAVRAAQAAGLTLIAIARSDGFELFTHPERILTEASSHVA